jgi:hypothetical protein
VGAVPSSGLAPPADRYGDRGIADGVGTVGYRTTAGLAWLDSFLNASMI